MKTDPTLFAGHLEFGDALVLNGLVRELSARIPSLVWPVSSRYVFPVRFMMSDLPGVRITGVDSYPDVQDLWLPRWPEAIRLGFFFDGEFDQLHWDREFYRQAGVDFNVRWSGFKFGFPLPQPIHTKMLIHEDLSRGYIIDRGISAIDRRSATQVTHRPSILDWLPEVLGAQELHVIDSAFLNLAESLYALGHLRGTRMVFHRYSKKYPGPARWPTLRAPWEVLE